MPVCCFRLFGIQVLNCSEEEFSSFALSHELEYRFECGYTKVLQFGDREDFVKAIWLHFVFFLPNSELVQLQKGFIETLKMEDLIHLHPGVVWDCLTASNCFKVTAYFLIDTFRDGTIYSEVLEEYRLEKIIIDYWTKYLLESEG